MSAVVQAKTGRIMAWKDSIPLHYEYTAGAAGELFLRELKEGRILASKCTTCGEVRVPPRTYCLECGAGTRIDVELQHSGRIASLSTVRLQVDLTLRTSFGFVTFAGVHGGLVHKILHDGRKDPKVGDPVMPLFLALGLRKGSILDVAGFRTAARTPVGND